MNGVVAFEDRHELVRMLECIFAFVPKFEQSSSDIQPPVLRRLYQDGGRRPANHSIADITAACYGYDEPADAFSVRGRGRE
jgi:hypothetical protein